MRLTPGCRDVLRNAKSGILGDIKSIHDLAYHCALDLYGTNTASQKHPAHHLARVVTIEIVGCSIPAVGRAIGVDRHCVANSVKNFSQEKAVIAEIKSMVKKFIQDEVTPQDLHWRAAWCLMWRSIGTDIELSFVSKELVATTDWANSVVAKYKQIALESAA